MTPKDKVTYNTALRFLRMAEQALDRVQGSEDRDGKIEDRLLALIFAVEKKLRQP